MKFRWTHLFLHLFQVRCCTCWNSRCWCVIVFHPCPFRQHLNIAGFALSLRETEGKDWVPCFPAHFGHWMWHARQKQKHNLPQATGNFSCWLNNHHFSRQTFDVSIFLNVRIMPLFLSYDTADWISLCFWIVALAIFHCFQMFPNRLIVKIISRVNNNENDHFFSGLFMMSNVTHQDK